LGDIAEDLSELSQTLARKYSTQVNKGPLGQKEQIKEVLNDDLDVKKAS
jgi:hypothetical protein